MLERIGRSFLGYAVDGELGTAARRVEIAHGPVGHGQPRAQRGFKSWTLDCRLSSPSPSCSSRSTPRTWCSSPMAWRPEPPRTRRAPGGPLVAVGSEGRGAVGHGDSRPAVRRHRYRWLRTHHGASAGLRLHQSRCFQSCPPHPERFILTGAWGGRPGRRPRSPPAFPGAGRRCPGLGPTSGPGRWLAPALGPRLRRPCGACRVRHRDAVFDPTGGPTVAGPRW
jgi:hypothetical protein